MEYARLSDEDLMSAVARGDTAAFEVVYDRYAGLAYSLALRMLGDRQLAEEVVQEAFVSAWRGAGSFDPASGRLHPWLFRIVRNRAIDELRRRRVRDGREIGGHPAEPREQSQDFSEIAWAAELRSAVGNALDELPEEQREVVEMAYMRGLSQREIAESTGIPLGTVKTRTRLALKKLRKSLAYLMDRERMDLGGG